MSIFAIAFLIVLGVVLLGIACMLPYYLWVNKEDTNYIKQWREDKSKTPFIGYYKPTVYYSGKAYRIIRDGNLVALLTPWHKHPKTGEEVNTTCITSNIINWDKDNVIETLNTHYVPLALKPSKPESVHAVAA